MTDPLVNLLRMADIATPHAVRVATILMLRPSTSIVARTRTSIFGGPGPHYLSGCASGAPRDHCHAQEIVASVPGPARCRTGPAYLYVS
jgi:hypothetical protein